MAQSAVLDVRASLSDLLIASALAAVFALQAYWSAATTSGTPDETTYLRAGLSVYHRGEFGPLADDGIAPLSVLVSYAAPVVLQTSGYASQMLVARTSAILLIGVPFVALVYWSLLRGCGRPAAAAGTSLLTFSPALIAHAALATTDICFVAAALGALLALIRYVEHRSHGRLAWLAAGLGAALSAKYSAIALFPATAVVLALTDRQHAASGRRIASALVVTTFLFIVALIAVWALHGFALAPTKIAALGSRRVPAALAGITSQVLHQRGGHPAFLFGRISSVGWWYYMPTALALKSTLPEVVIIVAALALVLATAPASQSAMTWRVTLVIFCGFALVNRLDLGVRYVLLILPLCVFIVLERWRRLTPALIVCCGVLLVVQMASAAAIAPHYLSYFNAIAGGPTAGYRYLADSNIDWGQDLPALRDAIRRHGAQESLVSYFGNAPFAAYSVAADVWDGSVQRGFDRWDLVAISATHLDGLFVPADVFAPFRDVEPSDRAGYSILIYSTDRPEVRAAMEATARRWREVR